jgi:5'-nucleotidase
LNLLLSNDDGIFAQGIRTLANTLAAAGHQVTVVCPDRERSATGHGLTLHKPIRAEVIEGVFAPEVTAWACSGTPADCVKLALSALLDAAPDMVLSGINHGPNLGTDVLYSGTVSAAMEGMIEGIPSIAFSLGSFQSQNFQPGADFAVQLVDQLKSVPLPGPLLLNVNIPAGTTQEIRGSAITRLGVRRYIDLFEKRTDPRGKVYYWLAGEVVEEVSDPLGEGELRSQTGAPGETINLESETPDLSGLSTDVQAIQRQLITLTPLQYNLTAWQSMAVLHQWQKNWQDGQATQLQ